MAISLFFVYLFSLRYCKEMENKAFLTFFRIEFVLIFTSLFLLSCSKNEEKVEGKWFLSEEHTDDLLNIILLEFKGDSLYMKDNITQEFKCKPIFLDSGIVCNNDTFYFKTINDTLIAFGGNIYSNKERLYSLDTLTPGIDLPKIEYNVKLVKPKIGTHRLYRFGKRSDNGEYSFFSDDWYWEIDDMEKEFVRDNSDSYVFAIDKNVKMSIVLQIFNEIIYYRSRPCFFITQSDDFTNRVGYRYGIRPYTEMEYKHIFANRKKIQTEMSSFTHLHNKSKSKLIFFLDSNNNVFIDSKRIDMDEISKTTTMSLKNDSALITILLFDKNIKFGNWLEVNSYIRSSYSEMRVRKCREIFNKEIEELSEVQHSWLTKTYLYRNIDFEIDNYNKLLKYYIK